jgi:RHS repeat-associated protein
MLSVIIAFGTFVTMTFGSLFLSDYVNLRNLIIAQASVAPKPLFYRYGELVGLYRLNYSDTTTLQYKIGENGDWTDYTSPFSIPAYQTTRVYARIGNDGEITYDDFTTTDHAIGVYTERTTDFDFSYNGINFGYTRIYNSADKNWFESVHSKVATIGSYLKVYLPDGTEYPLIRTGTNTYVDQLTGNSLTKSNNEYIFENGEYKYHFAIRLNSVAYLSGIEDSNGNVLNLTRTTNIEEASISDGTRTFAVSGYEAVEATDDPDVNYYSVKTITDPNNNDIEYTTKWGRYIQVKDQAGVTLGKYQYVSTANDYTLIKSNDKTIEYYTDGRLKKVTNDNGSWVQYTYTDSEKKYTTLTSSGETTCTVYNDAFLPVSYTDEYGTTTTYTYDSKFQVLTETVENETTSYSYDGTGKLISMTVRGGEEDYDVTYTYDNNGNVIHEQYGDSNSYYTYDSNNNVLVSATLKEDYEGEIPNEYNSSLTCFDTIVYNYDSSGRVLTETYSTGDSNAYVYDSVGNVTQETVTTVENGNTTTTVTNYTYDSLGNLLTSQTGNDNSSYTYDAAGRTLLADEGGECTRTLYDNQGRVVQEIGPEDYDSSLDGLPSANTYSDSTAGHTYVYDNTTGNLTSETNRLGVQTVYTYFETGEKKTEEFDIYKFCYNVKGLTTKVYISGTNTVSYNYDEDYNLTSTEYANGQTERYEYDTDGNLKYQYHNSSSTPFVTYTYNTDGELTEKVNTETGLRYEYDGETVEVYKTSNNTLVHSYSEQVTEADEENEVEARTDVTQSDFGVTTTSALVGNSITYTRGNATLEYSYTENSDYQMTADAIKYNNDTALSNQYIYDNDGNLIRQKNHQCLDNGQPLTVNYQYEYDSKDRITGKGYSGIEYFNHYDAKGQLVREDYRLYGDTTYAYSYDSRGNITSKKTYNYTTGSLENATPLSTKNFTYANSGWTDKLTSVDNTALTYDNVGNVLTYGNRSFTWSAGRSLAQVTKGSNTYSYTYDENGIRTSKTVNGTTTQYNTKNGVILAQSDGTNTLTFQYDTEGHPLGFTYNGTQYLYMVDVQGNVFGLANSDGTAIGQYDYDEWGNPTDSYTAENATTAEVAAFNANPLRYRGYYYDSETGYYYLQSRYYDPSICRFINADLPEYAQQSKEEPIGLNIFAYCCNDAVNYVDNNGFNRNTSKRNKYIYTIIYNGNKSLVKQGRNSYYYNYFSKKVIAKYVKTVDEFVKVWNNMNNIDSIYLYLHGTMGALYFQGESINISQLEKRLEQKSISGSVFLFSCRGGMGEIKKSVAYKLSQKTYYSPVYALMVGVSYTLSSKGYYARVETKYYLSQDYCTYWMYFKAYYKLERVDIYNLWEKDFK